MSSDIYARPDLSKKVRYVREVQGDRAEREDREIVIYESVDAAGDDHTDFQSHEGGPHAEKLPPAVQRRSFRAAALWLGVLCLLLLTGIIFLFFQGISVTLDKDKLQSRYNDVSNDNSQLQDTVSDMAVDSKQLRENLSLLQSAYQTLSEQYDQLQDSIKRDQFKKTLCPGGWRRFECSCYYNSAEKRTWQDSRKDCQNRGADLVVINSREEQLFVEKLIYDGASWIGLNAGIKQTSRRKELKWKWVDESPLTVTFWEAGHSQKSSYMYAECCNNDGKWTQSGNDKLNHWICELSV